MVTLSETGSHRLMLRQPADCNYFTRDAVVIEKMRVHFEGIISEVRIKCAESGINLVFATPCSGDVRIEGATEAIQSLEAALRADNKIL
jgi:hypothetical protein